MKYLSLVLALMLSACSFPSQEDASYRQLRAATWQVTIDERGTCSGVMVAPHHLLTAAHCMGDKMMVGNKPAMVVKVDQEKDLLLLLTVVDGPVVEVAKAQPKIDSKVVVVGYPLSIAQYLTEGRMQGSVLLSEAPKSYMAISANISFGNSGGGAFAKEDGVYKLIGIASAGALGYGLSTHLSLFVKTSAVQEFLGSQR